MREPRPDVREGEDASPEEEHETLSDLLTSLADRDPQALSIQEILEHFGRRAFGATLFMFAVPNLLPLPPGSSSVLAIPLLLIAPQLALGGKDPWIPRRLADRTVSPRVFGAVLRQVVPWLRKLEGLSSRRLGFMFGGPGDVVLGCVCTLLAAILVLPIPLGNLLPATAIAILGLSLTQRDGLLAMLGYAISGVSVAVLALSGHVVVIAVTRLGSWFGLW